jgi:uncharacterized protein with LGFP repeats
MSGQPRLRSTVIGRVAISLLAGAAMLLLAPMALATPESDADAAITAAWDASGGGTGSLGPRDGGVYPAGEGFGQNFAGGKIFFTPAVGAHIMKGAILEKYEALGGPANSDLGFPTIDEGAGRAPGSLNTTFSAADKPVIFWTPETGARVVRGPINAAWDKLGGSAGRLGVPAEDEAYRGDVVTQKFTGGEISYDARAKTFTTVPPELAGELAGLEVPDDPTSAINAARRAAGGALGPLGAAEGAPYPIGGDGLGQNFAGGKIFYSPQTGANVITGKVLVTKYESVGGPEGDLGFPTSNDSDGGLAPASRIITFAADDKPVIFWTPDYGAVIVRGAMNAAWEKLGGAKGELGAPMADQSENGNVITQRFSGGVVSWDSSSNSFTTEPANLASELTDLSVPGQEAPKAPSGEASDGNGDKGFQWRWWWWLLAVIPVLILVGLVAFAALRNRRGDNDERFDTGLGGEVPEYSGAPAADQAGTGDHHTADSFGDDYARGGLGVASSPLSGQRTYADAPISLWGSSGHVDEATEAQPIPAQPADDDVEHDDEHDDPDSVDTAPTRLPMAVERDPLTDTGRHARIEIDEPEPSRTALRLALDDSDEAPEGYPVKADTKAGLYWVPGSALYDDARAEIWFASEEFARANGFVRGDEFRG